MAKFNFKLPEIKMPVFKKPEPKKQEKKSSVTVDYKKLARDFWYGKPHGERRLGDLYIPKTGLYRHREWRGVKDTFYYFHMVWLYNYAHMVMDINKYGGLPVFLK